MSDLGAIVAKRAFLLSVATCVIAASGCSGGGSGSSPTPTASDPYGGLGLTPTFNQKVNFTVVIPPQAAPLTAHLRAKRRSSSSKRRTNAATSTSNPYVSPNVASVSFQVASVDGSGVRNAPAAVTVNVACGTNAGCSVPVQGVAAATGTDLYVVQTYSGQNATGNLVSSSSLGVVVPSTVATSFGGTSVTVGGLVQSLSITPDIPGGAFHYNATASGAVAVNALDPAGAVIIGDAILADAIAVVFPSSDGNAFTFPSGTSVTLPTPARVAFTYDGALITGTTVAASSVDFNGNPISASAPIPISGAATSAPTSPPSTKPPLSLYVYDYNDNRIIEFGGINDFEGGKPFAQTPRRVFELAAPSAAITCPSVQTASPPFVAGFAVRADGTLVALTGCTDATTATLSYVFTYAPTTVETAPVASAATPPPPTSTYGVNGGGTFNNLDLELDEAHDKTLLAFSAFPSTRVISYSLSNPTAPLGDLGMLCEPLIGLTTCDGNATTTNSYAPSLQTNIAVDPLGRVLVPTTYPGGVAPNPASANVQGEPNILSYPVGANGPAAPAQSELAGYTADLGPPGYPPSIALEGNDLFVGQFFPATSLDPSGDTINPGLSGCANPPSAQAIPDTAVSTCLGGSESQLHSYLVGFRNAAATLASASGTQRLTPSFEIGGDQFGGFGTGISPPQGDLLVVRDGYAYVLNLSENLDEIDIYNTNGVTGIHSDIAPVEKLSLGHLIGTNFSVTASAIAVGPTGTATGGNVILARSPRTRRTYDAWARGVTARRRAALLRFQKR